MMALAGMSGVELGQDQLETVVNAALILAPLVWSVVQKIKAQAKINEAQGS